MTTSTPDKKTQIISYVLDEKDEKLTEKEEK